MKIFVTIFAILIIVSAEEEDDEDEDYYYEDEDIDSDDYENFTYRQPAPGPKIYWTGNVKTLVDIAQLEPGIIMNISRNIFGDTTINCNGTMRMPNETFLPSPTSECDLTSMGDLREAVLNPQSFNSEKFLNQFWSSTAGGRLLKELQKRGVSEAVVKAAMKETWFNTTSYRDTAFNRLFLATNSLGSGEHIGYNSWYTFDVGKQNEINCTTVILGKAPPVVVAGYCKEVVTFTSWFLYPSLPFVDLILYTLCVWAKKAEKNQSEKCLVVIPGTDKQFQILQTIDTDSHSLTYLSQVQPYYHDYVPDGYCE